jgi:two-component system, OmpR family, response regulator
VTPVPFQIGVVEDDDRMRSTIVRGLRGEGLHVPVAVGTGAQFLAGIATTRVDVAVLDIGLPDCDGRDLCLAMRAQGHDVPVLFLTARDGVTDRLLGFNVGADDYLPKPFAFAELVARVSALGRRHVRGTRAEGIWLDPTRHCLTIHQVDGLRHVRLTPTEFRLLSVLMSRRGEVVRRRAMIAAAWSDGSAVADNTLDSYMARIRRKLRATEEGLTVTTVHGVGYRVE